jgi:hypothetical protein
MTPGEQKILGQLALIREDIKAMGTTISQQIDASTATLVADAQALKAALVAIETELASMPVGSTVTQAQADALSAAIASIGASVTEAQTDATPATPSPTP